jgi:hypothetical protein
MPALIPNPMNAKRKMKFLVRKGNGEEESRNASKLKLPVWTYPNKNDAKINAVPKCVIMR